MKLTYADCGLDLFTDRDEAQDHALEAIRRAAGTVPRNDDVDWLAQLIDIGEVDDSGITEYLPHIAEPLIQTGQRMKDSDWAEVVELLASIRPRAALLREMATPGSARTTGAVYRDQLPRRLVSVAVIGTFILARSIEKIPDNLTANPFDVVPAELAESVASS